MPVTLGALTSNRAETDIAIGEGVLHVVYRPGAISPAMLHRILEIDAPLTGPDGGDPTVEQALDRVDAAIDILLPVLDGWDLEEPDADGNPSGRLVPITADELGKLGLTVLWAIVRGIFMENRPDPTTPSVSPRRALGTSAQGARRSSGKPASPASRKN